MAKRRQTNPRPPHPKTAAKKGNTYDQILKENFRELVVPLVFRREGIVAIRQESLPEEINSTINRKIDFLLRIQEKDDRESIVHIEFQTRMPRRMIYRMAEYHGLLLAKYQLPIRHFVVYLGQARTKAPTQLPRNLQFSGFKLIAVNAIPFVEFIQSELPEEIILAILAQYPQYDPTRIARIILHRLKEVCPDEAALRKFITQLTLLSQLRNLEVQVKKITDNMPITLDLRKNAVIKELIAEELQAQADQYRLLAEEQIQKKVEEQRLLAEEQIQKKVEEQRLLAEEQIQKKVEEQRQQTRTTILNLHQSLQLEPDRIAQIMGIALDEILAVLQGEA